MDSYYGTGTFVRLGNFSCLVTAAHVLDNIKRDDALMRILDGRASDSKVLDVPIPKFKAYVGLSPADVAVMPLSDEVVAALPNRGFLHLNDFALRASYPGGCWLMGYPAETVFRSPGKMTYNPLMVASPLMEPREGLEGFDERFNFLLNATRGELFWPVGVPADLPNRLEGLSGCPVWQVAWPDGRWEPEHVRIVGVQTGYYRIRSTIVATHWGAVASLLNDQEDLRDILTMHLT